MGREEMHMNEMQDTGKWYEDVPYQECKSIIKERLTSMSRDFISVGYYLKYIRDKKLYKEDGYASVWEFAESNYGIKMSTASRWMAMNDKFSQGGNKIYDTVGYCGSFEETISLLRRKVVDQRLQNGLYELSEALEIIRATTEEIKAAIEYKGGHSECVQKIREARKGVEE